MFKKFISAFGFGEQEPVKEVTQVINVYDAVLAHRAWKRRLMEYMEGQSKEDLQPSKIGVDNLCMLGKWIHSDGKVQFGEQPDFVILVAEHAKFHVQAAKVVEAHQAGNETLAKEILTGSFDVQSRKTVSCLAKLHTMVEEREKKSEDQ